jgi:hypothetical protein
MKKPVKKSTVKKAQDGDRLSKAELSALSHQKRGMGQMSDYSESFVKKSGAVKNELGKLNASQIKQLKDYMSKSSTKEKIYQGLPNIGRAFGKSAADIPKGSKLEKQKAGGKVSKAKQGSKVSKKK